MRAVFQATSVGKDHWKICHFFLNWPLSSLQHPWFPFPPLGNLKPHLRHQHFFSLLSECMTSVHAGLEGPWLCHWGPQAGASAAHHAAHRLPKPPSSQTPVPESHNLHPPSPGYSATSCCCCFISAPDATSCKQWSCYHCLCLPTPLGFGDSFIHSFIHSRNNYRVPTMIQTLS